MTETPFHELSQKDRVAQCLEAVYKVTPDTARHILEVEREHKARDGNNWEEKTLTNKTTPDQAREVLRKEAQQETEKQQRIKDACAAEIAPLLKQIEAIAKNHGCVFGPRPGFTPDGRTVAHLAIEIVA